MARRIAVTGIKGGCGRTAVAVNLASALALRGHKTLLVDLDPKADATAYLGAEPGPDSATIYELLLGLEPNMARAAAGTAAQGLHLIPSARRLYGAELELAGEPERAERLGRILEKMEPGYSFVIVDCPSNFGLLTLNALRACAEAMIPAIGASPPSAVEGMLELIGAVQGELGGCARPAGIIPNMVDKRAGSALASFKRLEEKYGKRMIRSKIRLDSRLAESALAGGPIQLFAPKSNAAYDFEVLADDIMVL